MRILVFGLLVACASFAEPARLDSHLSNWKKMSRFLRLQPYLGIAGLKTTKVAILGHRYAGLENLPGQPSGAYLPTTAELRLENHSESSAFNVSTDDSTDRRLAQMIWGILGYDELNVPILRLYNARGPLNFTKAVADANAWGADVIFNTELFAGFGNGDGTGAIDRQVEQVARGGTLWVQSVGAFHEHTMTIPVNCHSHRGGKYVKFPDGTFSGRFAPLGDGQTVRIELSYNSWSRGRDTSGTDKDLNLSVYDQDPAKAKPIVSSKKRQVKDGENEDENTTLLPYEMAEFKPVKRTLENPYHVAISCERGTFDANDKLLLVFHTNKPVTLDAQGNEKSPLSIHNFTGSSILRPADLSSHFAITVGNLGAYTSRGLQTDISGREGFKPDLFLESMVAEFSDDAALVGSDVAAGQFAAVAAAMRAKAPELLPKHLLALVRDAAKKHPPGEEFPVGATREQAKALQQAANWAFPESERFQKADGLAELMASSLSKNLIGLRGSADGARVEAGLNDHPANLSLFSKLDASILASAENYAYFAYNGRNGMVGYAVTRSSLAEGKKPWNVYGGAARDYFRLTFLEMSSADSGRRIQSRLFQTLAPATLATWVSENP